MNQPSQSIKVSWWKTGQKKPEVQVKTSEVLKEAQKLPEVRSIAMYDLLGEIHYLFLFSNSIRQQIGGLFAELQVLESVDELPETVLLTPNPLQVATVKPRLRMMKEGEEAMLVHIANLISRVKAMIFKKRPLENPTVNEKIQAFWEAIPDKSLQIGKVLEVLQLYEQYLVEEAGLEKVDTAHRLGLAELLLEDCEYPLMVKKIQAENLGATCYRAMIPGYHFYEAIAELSTRIAQCKLLGIENKDLLGGSIFFNATTHQKCYSVKYPFFIFHLECTFKPQTSLPISPKVAMQEFLASITVYWIDDAVYSWISDGAKGGPQLSVLYKTDAKEDLTAVVNILRLPKKKEDCRSFFEDINRVYLHTYLGMLYIVVDFKGGLYTTVYDYHTSIVYYYRPQQDDLFQQQCDKMHFVPPSITDAMPNLHPQLAFFLQSFDVWLIGLDEELKK